MCAGVRIAPATRTVPVADVENEYGIYSRRVFALSAELALKGVLTGDHLFQRESGLSLRYDVKR